VHDTETLHAILGRLWRLLGETEEGAELHPKVAALAAALDDEAVLLKRTAALALATEAAFPLGADARVLDPAAASGACEALRLATDGMLVLPRQPCSLHVHTLHGMPLLYTKCDAAAGISLHGYRAVAEFNQVT